MNADHTSEERLFPSSYGYAYWAMYTSMLLGILLFSDLSVRLVIGFFGFLGGDEWDPLRRREILDAVGALAAATLAYMCFRYRRDVRGRIDKWVKFEFAKPISIDLVIDDTSGRPIKVRFTVDMDFWFEDEDGAQEARRIEEKIVATLELFLEEASRDPVARRSKTYFQEWIDEAFKMPKVAKIDVKSTDMRPI